MERAPLSAARTEQQRNESLVAARHEKQISQERLAELVGADHVTIQRWELGKTRPQPYYLEKLCTILGRTAVELGYGDDRDVPQTTPRHAEDTTSEAFQHYRASPSGLTLRFFRCFWTYPRMVTARYHELQRALLMELEDNIAMHPEHEVNRRDALRFLASLPVEACGLSALQPVLKYENTEILLQCAAGIAACWSLKRGRDLIFASDMIAKYVPTLKEIARLATGTQRKDAAELLAQCFLLQAPLARHLKGKAAALRYAQQAETYSNMAKDRSLEVLALRTQATEYTYADQWKPALQVAQQAKFLMETKQDTRPPVSPLIQSGVFAILATCHGYFGQKQEALSSLRKAHAMFFAESDSPEPVWVEHHQGTLVLIDGETHYQLGMYKEAMDSFAQVDGLVYTSELCRIEGLISQAKVEVNRDDQPRDMELCVDRWTRGIEGATLLKSKQRHNEAATAYTAMRAVWSNEPRVKNLRDYLQ